MTRLSVVSERLERLPDHCRPASERSRQVADLRRTLRRGGLHSVCEAARCPNLNGCFGRGTLAFMLLGDVCTRACRFCDATTGRPGAVDPNEPREIAAMVASLGLRHVVLTSVNRDDLPDQGSEQFARAVAAIRERSPATSVEVLTPDFRGVGREIDRVADARPEVYNHNVETAPSLYRRVRPGAEYGRSLALLRRVKDRRPDMVTKSGIMVGLGEKRDEVVEVLRDLRASGVDAVTIGQYLRPSLRHLRVERYVEPREFDDLAREAEELGFLHVASGPLVRSSFNADLAWDLLRRVRGAA
jgi:lipoic acid synthetase